MNTKHWLIGLLRLLSMRRKCVTSTNWQNGSIFVLVPHCSRSNVLKSKNMTISGQQTFNSIIIMHQSCCVIPLTLSLITKFSGAVQKRPDNVNFLVLYFSNQMSNITETWDYLENQKNHTVHICINLFETSA